MSESDEALRARYAKRFPQSLGDLEGSLMVAAFVADMHFREVGMVLVSTHVPTGTITVLLSRGLGCLARRCEPRGGRALGRGPVLPGHSDRYVTTPLAGFSYADAMAKARGWGIVSATVLVAACGGAGAASLAPFADGTSDAGDHDASVPAAGDATGAGSSGSSGSSSSSGASQVFGDDAGAKEGGGDSDAALDAGGGGSSGSSSSGGSSSGGSSSGSSSGSSGGGFDAAIPACGATVNPGPATSCTFQENGCAAPNCSIPPNLYICSPGQAPPLAGCQLWQASASGAPGTYCCPENTCIPDGTGTALCSGTGGGKAYSCALGGTPPGLPSTPCRMVASGVWCCL